MSECLYWQGKTRKKSKVGYTNYKGKGIDANRYVYIMKHGDIPKGKKIARTCQNILCVNVDHMFILNRRSTPQEIFDRHVIKYLNPNLCWGWKSNKDKDGYPLVNIPKMSKRAARVSYILHVGEIPKGMCVCHTCDNKICTNPKHLWLGSNKDNIQDMMIKGRRPQLIPPVRCGKDNNKTKLTEAQVLDIRKLHAEGKNYRSLAKIYKVTPRNVMLICIRKIWKHV